MRNPDSTNTFEKGMNRDNSPRTQPEATTRFVLNMVSLSEDGDIYSLINEKGTEVFSTLPSGYKLIGEETLDQDLIIFLVNPTNGNSQVGMINSFTGAYSQKLPVTGENADLNFSINHPIDVKARKIFTGERIAYFTDNYNPMGFVNLDNPPTTNILDNTRVTPSYKIPIIDFVETVEGSGTLHSGVYQFVAQYRTRDLNPSGYGIPTNPIPVTPFNRSVGRDKYEGGYPDNPTTVAKSLRINISNIDTDYPFLEIVAIHYDTLANTFTAFALAPLINITGADFTFLYTGEESNGTSLTIDDINKLPVIYDAAKCIEQKDDTLIYSNLSQIQERYDFQPLANNIITKYTIKEVLYVDGISPTPDLFFVTKPPFIEVTDAWDFKIEFSQPVDPVSGVLVTNYIVNFDPNFAVTSNPVSVEIDGPNPNVVIVHMNTASTVVSQGTLVTIQNIQNFNSTQTIPTSSYLVQFDTATTTPENLFFSDYKDEALTFDGKSLMREEIYSFGFGVIWKDGAQSLVYSIPGNNKVTTSTTEADSMTKLTGTYVSVIDYPLNQSYPAGVIRHHKMPTLVQEPHYRVDSDANTFLRILGIRYDNIIIPPEIRSKIQSIFFVRQARTTPQNRSIVAQGVINNMVLTSNSYTYDTGAEVTTSRVWKKNPFFNNFGWVNFPVFTGANAVGWKLDSKTTDIGALFSPDIVLGDPLSKTGEFQKMKSVLSLTGTTKVEQSIQSVNRSSYHVLYYSSELKKPLYLSAFANYSNIDSSFIPQSVDIQASDLFKTAEKRASPNIFSNYDVDNSTSSGFLLFKTNGTIPTVTPGAVTILFNTNTAITPPAGSSEHINNDAIAVSPIAKAYLYNFYKVNNAQYGALDSNEYVFMAQSLNPNITSFETYNGDVFISKFSYGNKDQWKYRGLYFQNTIPRGTNYLEATDNVYGYNSLGLKALGYFFVESTVNCNYRHQYLASPPGPKYFPKFSADDTLNEDSALGDSNSYNTQYSFENNVRSFIGKPSVFFTSFEFETRSIYSQKAIPGETADSYRIFPANNFYDIPRHTGPIWDSFVENNILYFHTPKSLWRTYMNEVAQQVSDTTQLILGTSGVFTIPAHEIFTEKGGYGGTISQWAGVHTPMGYIFPDALQGKIFLLANQSISEISQNGFIRFFNDNLSVLAPSDLGYVDNPFNPDAKGLHGVFDYELKRYILTKVVPNPIEGFTISYSFLNQGFTSFHTYNPNKYISFNNKVYGIDNKETAVKLHEHNKGPHGFFYNTTYPFILQFVINKDFRFDKTFDNLGIKMNVFDEANNKFIPLRNAGDFIQAFNDNKHTGNVGLNYNNSIYATKTTSQEFVKWKADRYQTVIPPNSVINDTNPIFDKTDLYTELLGSPILGNIDQNVLFRGRIKGDHIVISLIFSNEDDYKTSIQLIDSNFRVNNI